MTEVPHPVAVLLTKTYESAPAAAASFNPLLNAPLVFRPMLPLPPSPPENELTNSQFFASDSVIGFSRDAADVGDVTHPAKIVEIVAIARVAMCFFMAFSRGP